MSNDAGVPDAGPPEELSTVHFHGRWDLSTEGRALTVNSGSYVQASFDVTEVSGAIVATFDTALNQGDIPTLAWQIDGGQWQEDEIAASLTLAQQLTQGEHDVTLIVRGMSEFQSRWSPPLTASTTFLGFEVSGGVLLATPRPEQPKIEFLGDSITEGVAMYADRGDKSGASWRADARVAYASLVGMALEADYRQVGFGRLGLLIEGNGGVPVAADAFDWFFEGVPRDDWQADVVVINQGTNDGSNQNTTAFAAAYGSLLDNVRAAYPDAQILAMRPFAGSHQASIQSEVNKRRDAGDMAISYVDTTGWLSGQHFTDGVHPNPAGSEVVRDQLVPIIEPLL